MWRWYAPVIRPDGNTWASISAMANIQWSMVGVAWASAMAVRIAGMRAFLWAHIWRASTSKTARASISEKSLDTLGVNSRHAASRSGRTASVSARDFMGRIVSRWAWACVFGGEFDTKAQGRKGEWRCPFNKWDWVFVRSALGCVGKMLNY